MTNNFNVEYDKENSSVWIGCECGSGAIYNNIKTPQDLKNAVNTYIDNYISIESQDTVEEVIDDYHTMSELYDHRTILFASLIACNPGISWKSKCHDDGSSEEGWFIAGINLPNGQITYHQKMEFWDLFKCNELEFAPKWDGHTPNDVLERLTKTFLK